MMADTKLRDLWRAASRALDQARRTGRAEDWAAWGGRYAEYIAAKLKDLEDDHGNEETDIGI